MLLFLIAALRAILEMLGLCLLAQGMLHVLAGENRKHNVIFRLFQLVNRPPLRLVAILLPRRSSPAVVGVVCLVLVSGLWFLLAALRHFYFIAPGLK